MAQKSSFFNAVINNGVPDRVYKAEEFADYFSSFISNGVFPNPGTNLQVKSNSDMTVVVNPGKAWINGYYYINTDNLILSIDNADGVLKRIDRVVVRLDYIERNITCNIKKGSFASDANAPILQRDVDAYELCIAEIQIDNGVIDIQQSKITDTRLNSDLCGIVTQTINEIDTTTLYNQLQAHIEEKSIDMKTWIEEAKEYFSNWLSTTQTEYNDNFNSWFDEVKGTLEGDVAGNLLVKINELEEVVNNLDLVASKVTMSDGNTVEDAITANKTSILKNAKEIENLKQSASNGKNIVATAIGSPLQASDTFATMGTKIDTLTENFRNNLASKGIECLPTDKLSVLVNKVSQFKLFQKFPGTSEEIINDRSECTSTEVVGVWQLKRTIPIEEYFHGIRMSYITVGVFGFTSKIEHIRGNQILTSNSTSDQSTKITLDIMDLQVGDKILMYAQTNENYAGNKSYGGWKNLVVSYSWRPVEGEEV